MSAISPEEWTAILLSLRVAAIATLVATPLGIAVAWLHKAAALTKRSFLGKGWITVSTFDFTSDEARANPLAPHVLKALAES